METLNNNSTDGNGYIFAEAEGYLDSLPLLEKGDSLFLDNYTLHDLTGSNLEVVIDAQKKGLFTLLEIPDEALSEFINFGRTFHLSVTYGQLAALFHAARGNGQYVLVSRSPIVVKMAQELSVPVMGLDFFMPRPNASDTGYPQVFRNEIDEQKVFDTLREIREEESSPLKEKAYWIVPIKVFKQYGWLCCTQKDFIERVNTEFKLEPPLKEGDIKYGSNQITAKAESFCDWPNNPYRDLAYKVHEVFFGEEKPWGASGLFDYEQEKNFTKGNIEIHHSKH